jgi:transposase
MGQDARRHGQEISMTRTYIGVDLAKDSLEICDPLRGGMRVANRPAAIARWFASLGAEDFVVHEATSGCDRPLRAALGSAGCPGARLNPLHAWHYGRSRNRAKTDRLDGRLLADHGRERQPDPDPAPDPAREALRALVRRRDQLKRMQVQEKSRLSGALAEGAPALVVRDLRSVLAGLARRVPASRRRSAPRSQATAR